MAAIQFYLTNNLASVHQELSTTSPGADATTSPNYGWTVGFTAAGNYSKADAQVERAASTFATTPIEPDGSIDTTIGDCWRSASTLSGTFDSANWVLTMTVIAVSVAAGQSGNAGFRIFRSANADGSSATEITGARQEGSAVVTLTTLAQQSSAATFNPGSFSVTNEYIFIQVGWEVTVAASGHTGGNADVIHRIGTTASQVLTANFTPSAPSTFLKDTIGRGIVPWKR